MSTRTASSMTPRGGGGGGGSLPPTQWQRPASCQEPLRKQTRGYAVSSGVSKSGHSSKPTTPPPSMQERGDRDRVYRRNVEEYRRNGFERDRNRYDGRERDYNKGQGYNDRLRSNDRRGMVDGGNLNSNARIDRNDRRYDHRHPESSESSLNMNNRRRPIMMGGDGENSYDDRRPIWKNENHSGNGYRVSMDHRHVARRENFGRDHGREQDRRRSPYGDMNDFGGHHNDRDCHRSRYPMEQEHHTKTSTGGRNPRRHEYNAKESAHQEQQWPNQVEHLRNAPLSMSRGDSKGHNIINGYDDEPRFSNHRDTWDSGTKTRNQEGTDRNSSGWKRGMRHPNDGRAAFWEDGGGERHSERYSSEVVWDRFSDNRDRDRGVMSGKAVAKDVSRFPSYREGQQQRQQSNRDPVRSESTASVLTCASQLKEDMPSYAVISSARKDLTSEDAGSECLKSTLGDRNSNITNEKKRKLDHHERPKIEADKTTEQTRVDSYPSKHVEKSSLPSSETSYENPKKVSGGIKKSKISASVSPSLVLDSSTTIGPRTSREIEMIQQDSQRGTNVDLKTSPSQPSAVSSLKKIPEKLNTKTIPVKASSALSIKKHQIQSKPKPKVINKLGIPMRWLKPKAKPKPPARKVPPKVIEDTSKSMKIPSKQSTAKKSAPRPSSPSNRLVTDSSEGSSIVSYNKNNTKSTSSSSALSLKKQKGSSVPAAIVTKNRKEPSKNASKQKSKALFDEPEEDDEEDGWDSQAESEESDGEASESDTDDEVLDWATKMLGVQASPSSIHPNKSTDSSESNIDNDQNTEVIKTKSPKLKIRLSSVLKLKLSESIQSANDSNALSAEDSVKLEAALKKLERSKKKREKLKALSDKINEERPQFDHEKAKMEIEEERRRREEAKPLTAKELRKILREDTSSGGDQNNWVRRSRRQPNMARLNSKPVRILVDKLKYNDTDMRVLKMKKYINDPNTPCAVMDAILNAMEENTNCEALYIQNFNEGMRDEQVIHLLRILQQPSCKIWCLNIGENYNVSDGTWERFTKGLIHTKITHMYASEHTITSDMKDEIRFTIRENRKKHDMHINPNNLDVIIQCTHCWWNPINAKVLRPFLKKKGFEHVLKDKEAQGLQGSTSMAPTS